VLDPFGTLGTAVQVARITHLLSQGALPGLIVVGVGPASDALPELNQQRMLDLTPSIPDPAPVPPADAARMFGGGDAFLRLLVDVIAPYVEATHQGDPQDRTIAGWSLGGLLGAHALLSRPSDFRRYLLVSPSLWWANAELLTNVDRLRAHSGKLAVYLAAGDREQTTARRAWPAGGEAGMDEAKMVDNLRTFAGSLRGLQLPALTLHDEVLAGEHHITIWPAAFSRGLLALHATSYPLES